MSGCKCMIWSVRKEGQGSSSGECHFQKFGIAFAVNTACY